MNQSQILAMFKETGAILEGHFKLSSGLHSRQYLQCARVLQHPVQAEALCKALAQHFANVKIDTVIAPALGGIIVSYEFARALGVKSLFTERVDGKMTLRRGFALGKGEKVLVVEDVITTGLSTSEVVKAVKSSGAEVVGVGSLVDRSSGKLDFGAPFKSLIKIDMPTFKPENCPLCKSKIPVIKPGSRN